SRAEQSRAEQSRAEQSRAEQSRAEQSRAEQSRAEQYLSKTNAQCLKGIFAIAVLCHHMYQYSGLFRGKFGIILQALGYLSVGIFFFFTGYGLIVSYQEKKEFYIKNFLRKRVLPFYLFYLFLTAIYALWRIVLNIEYTRRQLIQSIIFKDALAANSWYLQVIIVFYIFFWITAKVVKDTKKLVRMIIICSMLYCVGCFMLDVTSTRYESFLCIALGTMWAVNKKRVDKLLDIKGLQLFLLSIILFGVFCSTYIIVDNLAIQIFSKMASALAFSSMAIIFVFKLSGRAEVLINNPVTQWLGKYSLEIYVIQGIFLLLRKGTKLYIQNPYVFIVVCVIGTLLLAIVIKSVYDWIVRKCRPQVVNM
ncbi:MAG TPA: acyltransferase, partial [[Clostridium] spiroforme]|nr:acyltransferase [Thomasclavelia spiroformis]